MTARFAPSGIWYGGDYNPEQSGPGTWTQDDALMRAARVDTATVGVFSWSVLEPEEGRYAFGWLDRTLDRLHANGVRVVLATPTASPPPWFTAAHPDALPVTAEGTRLWHGSRDTYCAAAPAYRAAALRVAQALAARYAGHPALALWHVHNEYGTRCHCDHAAAAFRRWLRERYGDLDTLVTAWNGAFWSQAYSAWDQVLPPRATQYLPNPAQLLDWSRFWSDELLAAFVEQRDALRRLAPAVPVTTNAPLPGGWQPVDLSRWSAEVDVVAVDHYPAATGIAGREDLAFGADRARALGGGAPWLLMEQAVGVTYLPDEGVIVAKPPGAILADSLGYVARGADGVLFFQWRAGRGGAELHHGAMVPHAGPDTRIHREVAALGAALDRLDEVTGSRVRARVAVVRDADTCWALQGRGLPSAHLDHETAVREVHAALWRSGVTADVVHARAPLDRYAAVFAPSLYVCPDTAAASLRSFVAGGGHLVLGCFCGVVDGRHRIRSGGDPGGLGDVLGVRVEEFHPLLRGERVPLEAADGGTPRSDAGAGGTPWSDAGATGTLWSEHVHAAEGTEVLVRYAGGPLAGLPAVTRRRHGGGSGWYVSTRPDAEGLAELVRQVLAAAGVGPELPGALPGVEAVRRHGDGRRWLFVTNHRGAACTVAVTGVELLTGRPVDGLLELAPGAVAVVRERPDPDG